MTVEKEKPNPAAAAIKAALADQAGDGQPESDKPSSSATSGIPAVKDRSTQAKAALSIGDLLFAFPAIEAKLREALLTRHFFITISCQKVTDRSAAGDDLQHYWEALGYPSGDVPQSLRHLNENSQQFEAEKIIDMIDRIEDNVVAEHTAKILKAVFEGVNIDNTMRHLVGDYLAKNFPASTPEGSGAMR